MKRALLVTTISGFVPQFEMNSVSLLQENGYEVHYASNFFNVFYGKDNSRLDGTGIVRHQIDFARSPYSKNTITAYKQLDKLLGEIDFDVIHCHTPIGGIIARLVGTRHKVKKIVYTAHGFHFYKGAPIKNWIIYYMAEKIMAKYTDALLTINKEDYKNAKSFHLKQGGKVYYLLGAGIDVKKYKDVNVNKINKRQELGLNENDFIILSVGELNKNKNHEVVIRALAMMNDKAIKYLICGEGTNNGYLERLINELGLQDCVRLMGYRTDIPEIEKIANIFVFPSLREGLPVSMMEAMASGLPIIASNIRGCNDLIKNGENGFLISAKCYESWADKILFLKENSSILNQFSKKNSETIEMYDRDEVKRQLAFIYREQGII